MKLKLTAILAPCVAALALLLGTAAAQAATVILEGNNVIRIENLEVNLDQGGPTFLDVDFVNDTGYNVYGNDLQFPFTEEDAAIALVQVNETLNVTNPVPTGSGPLGTRQHFVGADEDPLTGLIGGVGGEYFSGPGEWDRCDTDCIFGVKPLNAGDFFTYAVFSLAGSGGNQPPQADANGPYTGEVGVAVSFDGTGSHDPDGSISTYTWDFGDNTSSSGATPSHTYTAAGNYSVSLTVTDNEGATDSDSTTANISSDNLPPVADAGGPYTGTVNQAVSFDGTGSNDPDGSISTYAWDFGDRADGSGATPSHAYAAAGMYNVSLVVTDNDGASGLDSTTVVIGPTDQPSFPCNVNLVSGVIDDSEASHEACEVLVAGPDFIAEDGSDVTLSSGFEIWFMSDFLVEKGATLNVNVCGQSLCETSTSPMPYGCHSCVSAICDVDSWCCIMDFDAECLVEVSSICDLSCN